MLFIFGLPQRRVAKGRDNTISINTAFRLVRLDFTRLRPKSEDKIDERSGGRIKFGPSGKDRSGEAPPRQPDSVEIIPARSGLIFLEILDVFPEPFQLVFQVLFIGFEMFKPLLPGHEVSEFRTTA